MSGKKESMTPTRSFRAKVEENRPLKGEHYLITFSPLAPTVAPQPGQFYMLGAGEGVELLLKRPFCFFERYGENVSILYRVRGKGTKRLSNMKPGDGIEIVGPLGNSYPAPPRKITPLVIAGGTAVASVYPHLRALKGRAVVLYGARTKDELVMVEEVRSMAGELHVCTDDGSFGRKGSVLDGLKDMGAGDGHLLYVCGPRAMTRAVAEYSAARGLKGYASLEEYMACGIGACMGCVVDTKKGYRRVCREGPVFKLDEIVL